MVSAQTTHNPDNGTTNPFTMANGERINKPKSQLRQVITDWMTVTRGYRTTTVSDMWGRRRRIRPRRCRFQCSLMGDRIHEGFTHRPLHVLRFRFLEIITKAKLHA